MTSNTPAAAGQADCRTRFIFDDMPVRGLHVRLQEVWQHIVGRKHYPAAIRRALGELLAAVAAASLAALSDRCAGVTTLADLLGVAEAAWGNAWARLGRRAGAG